MRFAAGCVSVEGLVVSASRENAIRAYAVNFGVWPIEGPVKCEEADGGVHTLDSAPQVFTVFGEVIVSGITLSPLVRKYEGVTYLSAKTTSWFRKSFLTFWMNTGAGLLALTSSLCV